MHLEDVVGAPLHSLDDRARGPVVVTAPAPTTGPELEKAPGRSVRAR